MIVEDVMTRDTISVTEQTSIGEAMSVMTEQGFRHLPVVRGRDVVGILSDRDFGRLGLSVVTDLENLDQLRARLARPVTALMSGSVVTVDLDAEVSEVVDLFLEEQLGAVPVVESGTQTLVGIISYVDVLRAARDLLDES